MGPFRVQADAAVFVHMDRPDHAWVVPAGVHEVPDRPARLVLVDRHRSGPTFRPAGGSGLSCRWGGSAGVSAGPRGLHPGRPESWPGGRLFCPFCPAFSGPEGGAGDPGRGGFSPDRRKRTCVKKVRGGIQLRVVGFTRSALCNERSFRTDVSICTICRYGSARAGVQEKCPAVRERGTGGALSKKLRLN